MNIVTKVPAAYRPADLGQRQRQYLRDKNWIDNRTVGKLPALLAKPPAGLRSLTEAPAVANVGHICLPLYDEGRRCWCGAKIEESPK